MANMGLSTQVSTDACPGTPQQLFLSGTPGSMFGSVDASMDARPGPADTQYAVRNSGVGTGTERNIRPDNLSVVRQEEGFNKKMGKMSLEDDQDSSYCSMSSLPSDDWEKELREYENDMPPPLKVPYFDVLILYAEKDRNGAEIFRNHLINDIKIPKYGPIKALLYDCPELTSLAQGQISHLAEAVARGTYIFMFLTENFVKDKWMEFSSESCLMESIYNPAKLWCVVPVYTVRRGKFRVPMGLNSLKGINYYNNDEFYRNSVSRLIGDKAHVRVRENDKLVVEQKKWVEDFKRQQAEFELRKQITKEEEERKTKQRQEYIKQQFEYYLQHESLTGSMSHSASESTLSSGHLPSYHRSESEQSIKQLIGQNPAVVQYFQELLHGPDMKKKNSCSTDNFQKMHSLEGNRLPGTAEPNFPLPGNLTHGRPQSVRRSPSQASNVSGDMGEPSLHYVYVPNHGNVSIPPEIWEKIKDLRPLEQLEVARSFIGQNQQSPCIKSKNMVGPDEMQVLTKLSKSERENSLDDRMATSLPRTNVPKFDEIGSIHSHPGNSYGIPSDNGTSSLRSNTRPSYSAAEGNNFKNSSGDSSQGNLPNVFNSLMKDCASTHMSFISGNYPQERGEKLRDVNMVREEGAGGTLDGKSSSDSKEKKKKRGGQKIYNINIINPGTVQLGDGNVVVGQQGKKFNNLDSDEEAWSEEEEEELSDEGLPDEGKTTQKKMVQVLPPSKPGPGNPSSPGVRERSKPAYSMGDGSAVMDAALSSVGSTLLNPLPSHTPTVEPNSHKADPETEQTTDVLPPGLKEKIQDLQKMETPSKKTQIIPVSHESPKIARITPMIQTAPADSDSDNELTEVKRIASSDETDVKSVYSVSNSRPTRRAEPAQVITKGARPSHDTNQIGRDSGTKARRGPTPLDTNTNQASASRKSPPANVVPFGRANFTNPSRLFYNNQFPPEESDDTPVTRSTSPGQTSTGPRMSESVEVKLGEDPLSQDEQSNGFTPLSGSQRLSDDTEFDFCEDIKCATTPSTQSKKKGKPTGRFSNFFSIIRKT